MPTSSRLRTVLALLLPLLPLAGCGSSGREPDAGSGRGSAAALLERAERLAREVVVVDTHVDLPYRLESEEVDVAAGSESGDFDYPRARRGGLDAAFLSIYVPSGLDGTPESRATAERLIDRVEALVAAAPDKFALARSPDELVAVAASGRVALPMGMENGGPIGDDLGALGHFFARGIRYVTLTHAHDNQICDSSYSPPGERRWGGLSPFGREVVAEMNRLGMMVDVSHLSDAAFDQVLAISRAPVIASHSSCRRFTPGFERNLDDDRIRALAAGGGVIQINFGSAFLTEAANRHSETEWAAADEFARERGLDIGDAEVEAFRESYLRDHPLPRATLADVVAHVEHVIEIAGVDHVGFGSDFEGVGDSLPAELRDVSMYPNLIAALLARGHSEADVAKIAAGNLLRVWREVERVAAALRSPG